MGYFFLTTLSVNIDFLIFLNLSHSVTYNLAQNTPNRVKKVKL